jgi:hypothetical protein
VRLRTAISLLLAIAACAAAGCGSDKEPKPSIPQANTNALLQQLGSIEDRFKFGDGACNDIAENQTIVNDQIAALPKSVDSDVRSALQDSFDHLFDLTSSQCDTKKGENTDTETTPTETTDTTSTTETTTTSTETTDTTTSTDTTQTDTGTTDTTPVPPDDGNGGGAQGPQQ